LIRPRVPWIVQKFRSSAQAQCAPGGRRDRLQVSVPDGGPHRASSDLLTWRDAVSASICNCLHRTQHHSGQRSSQHVHLQGSVVVDQYPSFVVRAAGLGWQGRLSATTPNGQWRIYPGMLARAPRVGSQSPRVGLSGVGITQQHPAIRYRNCDELVVW
jgi:hypothetical protein